MSRRYQVKFPWEGETRFGIVESHDKELAKKGEVLVEDAVKPERYAVPEADLTDIPVSFKKGDEYCQYVEAEFEKACKLSEGLPSGVHVGKMFKIPVADGYAWYIVTKVNKSTCKVEWRGFCLDRWTDHHFGYGGMYRTADVARYVEREEAMASIFKKGKV